MQLEHLAVARDPQTHMSFTIACGGNLQAIWPVSWMRSETKPVIIS